MIGKSTINEIWSRHFLDSSQVIDFIDKNTNSLIDLGSGAGFPGLIIARSFKPLKVILRFLDKNTENWKKIFLFLGKTGQVELLQASKSWDIKYKQRMSVTSNDSIVIEFNKLKKK